MDVTRGVGNAMNPGNLAFGPGEGPLVIDPCTDPDPTSSQQDLDHAQTDTDDSDFDPKGIYSLDPSMGYRSKTCYLGKHLSPYGRIGFRPISLPNKTQA